MADQPLATRPRPRPRTVKPARYNSLVAAATVMLRPGAAPADDRARVLSFSEWQQRSAAYFDRIPEYRSGVGWQGNCLSRINLVAARPPSSPGDEPEPIDPDDPATTPAEARAVELVAMIAGGAVGQGMLMRSIGEQESIAGITYLVIEPDLDDPESDEYVNWNAVASSNIEQRGDVWRVKIDSPNWRAVHPNALVVKIWRRHPLRPWEPDAPVRALLGVLHQIDMLSESITASATSRLAGAGILAIPSEATFPQIQRRQPGQTPPEDVPADEAPDDEPLPGTADEFIETLIDTMVVPIKDRGTAAAVVPLVIQIPGEHLSKIQHITFNIPLDQLTGERLDAAIRRFAVGMDMPPEALLGLGDVNHWTAWQISESGITLHIEPMAESACEGLTDGWLTPALEAENIDPAVAMVWYDTTDLRTRPDKSAVTTEAYDRREASAKSYRREIGLDDEDAPEDDELRVRTLLHAMELDPALVGPILVELGYLTEETLPKPAPVPPQLAGPPEPVPDAEPATGPPQRPVEAPDEAPDPAIAAALLAACDGIVYRALDRGGSRLRSAAGRKVHGGASVLDCDDPARLHCQIDATVYSDLDFLLDGAWNRVPEIANRYGVDADALTVTLAAYCRSLLAAQHAHSIERLAGALGLPCSPPNS